MGSMRRLLMFLALFAVFASFAGCSSLFHELQFHRLWRMNRGPSMSSDVYFSVPADEQKPSEQAAP